MHASDGGGVRRLAVDILVRVEQEGAWAGILLNSIEGRVPDARDRALLHTLVLEVLRRRSILDHVLSRVASRPVDRLDPDVRAALHVGILSLLFLDRVPDFAAVSPVVDVLRRRGRGVTGFVNGVLRRVAREREALLPPPPESGDTEALARFLGHPTWWTDRIVARLGWDAARSLLEANNRPAPTVLRPDRRSPDVDRLGDWLAEEGVRVEPSPWVPGSWRVIEGAPQRTVSFRNGRFWIQDEASQLVPMLLGAESGDLVVDACAAPGGKTLALAEAVGPGGRVVAIDVREERVGRLRENLARLQVQEVMAAVADLTCPAPLLPAAAAAVLVDAPCSGTGTLRRHPEIRWRLAAEDLAPLVRRQQAILERASELVRPGGRLVYAVCSMEPEEGEQVVETFVAGRPEFRRLDPRDRLPAPCRELVGDDLLLRTGPAVGGMDGFQVAVLERAAASPRER